jgi:protein gp37
MGADSAISWTDHTFNPWWGCERVSPGCQHCYAETLAKRFGTEWGKTADRRFFGDKHWNEPVRWNKAAARDGVRRRVFCASMADVFEDRDELTPHRERLFPLIRDTPHLDWLLLTKRPLNVQRMVPGEWNHGWPANVWLGFTAEDQARYDERSTALWSTLMRRPRVVFVSAEPLLGPITDLLSGGLRPDWVIVGGESGPGARPMHPAWARDVLGLCKSVGEACTVCGGSRSVPVDGGGNACVHCWHSGGPTGVEPIAFHFKQWGEFRPLPPREMVGASHFVNLDGTHGTWSLVGRDGKPGSVMLQKLGKHDAGRVLDGRTWDELPADRGDR